MNRDLLKTAGGIIIIGAIIVATFLYGNQQRQEQVRRDQEVEQQQDQANEGEVDVVAEGDQDAATGQPDSLSAPGGVGGGQLPATTPQAGGEVAYLLPLGALGALGLALRRSRQQLRAAYLRG